MNTKRISANEIHISVNYKNLFLLLCMWLTLLGFSRLAFALPPQFQDQLVRSGLNFPTSMIQMPDGRMLVTEKTGRIWILDPSIENPVLASYMNITNIDTVGERGLLDIVLDPDFTNNHYIYVSYHRSSERRIFISRFTDQGNTASLATEFVVWKEPQLFPDTHQFHHGGGLSFGPDGHLYLTTGYHTNTFDAQDLTSPRGKIIRVAKDGSIPADNPFVNAPGLDEIWAYGLRNPWRARWDLQGIGSNGPRLYIGEVGNNNNNTSNEDIHIGRKGANYGFPICEGNNDCNTSHALYDPNQDYDAPIFTYEHGGGEAAVMGGIVYHGSQFPAPFTNAYFYGDYPSQKLRYLTFDNNGAVTSDNDFLNAAGLVVDIKEGADGALYYIQIASDFNNFPTNSGALRRIRFNNGNQPPQITTATANPRAGVSPLTVQFNGAATDPDNDPLEYLWLFGDGVQALGATVSHDYNQSGSYQARLQVSDAENTTTLDPPITITVGSAPQVTIDEPLDGSLFRAGDTINFAATATDADGVLTDSSYKWTVNLAHNQHIHPETGPITGTSGSFIAPDSDHSYFDDTGFLITVEVTDADGISTTKSVRIEPEEVDITFNTQPAGIDLIIDDETLTTPFVYDSAIGFNSSITAPQTTCINNTQYSFTSWSNGQTASFTYTVPNQNTTLTAIYAAGGSCGSDGEPPADVCGQNLEFDGTTDWVNIPNMSFANDFTIEGWVKLAPGIDFKDAFIGQEGRGPDINFHAGLARLYVGSDAVTATTPMQPNTWTHLAITRSGSNLSLYLNGLLDATGNWSGTLPVKALGRGNRVSLGSFKGEMDEVRFWNVARSGTQINQNYNQSVAPGSTGLVGYWTFNESGQVVADSSDSGQNASLGANTSVGNDDPARIATTAPFNENCSGGPQNNAPIAQNDSVGPLAVAGTTTIPVLDNDTDSDGTLDLASVTIVNPPANGTATVLTSGVISYIHDGSTTTSDQLTYTVDDNNGAVSNQATVSITVATSNANLPPFVQNDLAGPIASGSTTTIPVLDNDNDSDGTLDTNSVTIVTPPINGIATVLASGAISYIHDGSTTTSDQLTYTVDDNDGAVSNQATVNVTITQQTASCGISTAFDGTTDWINIPNQSFASDFTIEGWVKLAPGIDFKDAFIGQEGRGPDINFHAGLARLYVGSDAVTATTPMQPNTWTHLAITRSGSNLSLYLNGLLDATGNWSGTLPVKALGRGNRVSLGSFKGEMDEVRFWNVARSGTQINQNYNQSVAPGSTGLVGYWTFNESGQVVADSSDSGQNASLGANTSVGNDDPARIATTAPFNENCSGGTPNTAPVAQNDTAGPIASGSTVTIPVLNNDTDSDGNLDSASVAIVDAPSNGTVSIDPLTGEVDYTHDGSSTTSDSFTYSVQDTDNAVSNIATVTITVTSTTNNTAPVAQNDTAGLIASGSTVTIPVLNNDTDSDGNLDAASVVIIAAPGNGTVSVDPITGEINYTHDGSSTTSDSFTYSVQDTDDAVSNIATVTITVTSTTSNTAPVAQNDTTSPIASGSTVTIPVLNNDTDSDSNLDATSVIIVAAPNNGTVSVDPLTGKIDYTHDGSSTTSDSFTYSVEDTDDAVSNVATVNLTIMQVTGSCGLSTAFDGTTDWINIPNQSFASDFTIEGWVKLAPGIDFKDAFIGQEGRGPDINFHAGLARLYVGSDAVTATTPMQPNTWTHLAITRSGSNLSLYLNGLLDATGNWSGTLPVKALGRGNRVSLGSFKGEMDEVRFWNVARSGTQINQNYNQSVAPGSTGLVGYWTFNESGQVVADSSGSGQNASLGANTSVGNDDPARIATTAPFNENCSGGTPNTAPVAQNDTAGPIASGSTVTIPVLNNDTDSDGNLDSASVAIVDAPSNGSVSIDLLTGEIDYTHDGSSTTSDSFTYSVEDTDDAVSNIATVTITVTSTTNNTAPVAQNDTASPIAPGSTVTIPVLNNDTDSDGNLDATSVAIVDAPSNGTVSVDPLTGEIDYTHDGSSTTSDSFTYSVEDTDDAVSNIATVTITVTSTTNNTAPVAQNDTASPIAPGSTVTIPILNNDTDNDGNLDSASVAIVTDPGHGTVSVDPLTGEVDYTHDGSSTTSDSFTYSVQDTDDAVSNTATVSLTIMQVTGSCGTSTVFDGNNDWINIPNQSFASDFTIEGWVKLAPGIDFKDAFIGQEGRGPDINFHAGLARLYVGSDAVTATTPMQPNTWTHLAITRSGSNLSLYLNGLLDATGNWSGTLPVKALGRGNRVSLGSFKGEMDEVRFWNVARSGTQINQNYNQSVAPGSTGLVGYWTFNESGQVVADSSGSGQNASLGANPSVGNDDPARIATTAPFNESCGGTPPTDSPIQILPLGDSITDSINGNPSYRRSLWQQLNSAGYNVDFVGRPSYRHTTVPPELLDYDIDHEGHSGFAADRIEDNISSWLNDFSADIVLLHIGTNDLNRGRLRGENVAGTVDQTLTEIDGIIQNLRARNNSIIIILAKIIPMRNYDTAVFNDEMDAFVSTRTTTASPIVIVDQYTGFDPIADNYDNFHPNAGGETKMADKWFQALEPFL